MPGEVIELEGDARALVAAVTRLAGYDFALIGGLAVMVRLQEAHRVTGGLDGVFDNPTDVPTTADRAFQVWRPPPRNHLRSPSSLFRTIASAMPCSPWRQKLVEPRPI